MITLSVETHESGAGLDASGTSLQGYINTTYAALKAKFGQPRTGDGYKVDAEWVIRDRVTGVLATIYNYKDGKNYNGASGTPKTKITDWHIGGRDRRSVELVHSFFTETP